MRLSKRLVYITISIMLCILQTATAAMLALGAEKVDGVTEAVAVESTDGVTEASSAESVDGVAEASSAESVDGVAEAPSVEVVDDGLEVALPEAINDDFADCDLQYSSVSMQKVNTASEDSSYKNTDIIYRKSGINSISKPSQKKIIEAYKKYTSEIETVGEAGVYAKEPTVYDFAPGSLTDSYLNYAEDNLNFIRMLAGLTKVEMNSALNESAQYGALLSAANKKISHSPKQPEGMAGNIYKLGSDACAWSNLYSRIPDGVNKQFAYGFVSFMNDNNSASNLAGLGHRRWILNPYFTKTGFGQVAHPKDESTTSVFGATVMRVTKGEFDKVDPESKECGDYNFVSWPASGNFPVNEGVFNFASVQTPWSVTVNPSKYAVPAVANIKITVTRESDNKTWKFDASDARTPSSKNDKYLLVNTKGYGINNAIIFNFGGAFEEASFLRDTAANAERDASEMSYTVSVAGLKTTAGADASINYRINFFDITNPDTASSTYNSADSFDESGNEDVNPGGDETPTQDVIVEESKEMHTVRFDGAHPDSQKIEHGGFISPLPNYDDEVPSGFYFASWYVRNEDGTFKSYMTENTPVVTDMHLYPYFMENTSGRVQITGAYITVADQLYTGYALTPDVQVKLGNEILEECTDYSVTYVENVDSGNASVRIKGIGKYTGEKSATFKILPRQLKNVDVWFEPLTGFETGTLSESALIKRLRGHFVDDAKSLLADIDFKISLASTNLKIVNGIGKMTVVVTGKGNYTGSVKCSFNCYSDPNAKQLSSLLSASAISTSNPAYDSVRKSFVYTGTPIKPAVKIEGLSTKDYAVKYKNNKEAGKARVIIAGKGEYKGQNYTLYFEIARRDISEGADGISVAPVVAQAYKGKPVKPKIVISSIINGKKKPLKKNQYKITYTDNNGPGVGTATIKGVGSFSGSRIVKFDIN